MKKKKIFLSLVLVAVVAGFFLMEYKLMKLFSPEPPATQSEKIDVPSYLSESDESLIKADSVTNRIGDLNREIPPVGEEKGDVSKNRQLMSNPKKAK